MVMVIDGYGNGDEVDAECEMATKDVALMICST